jgi:hypothetical protein
LTSPADLIQYRAIVSLFSTPGNTTPSIRNIPAPPDTPESLYQENVTQFRACEVELADAIFALRQWLAKRGGVDGRVLISDGEVFCKLGALNGEPTLRALESQYNKTLQKRAALLAEHARLKLAAGLTR